MLEKTNNKTWKRICPVCKKDLLYSRQWNRNNAEHKNTICMSCALKGKNHPMYGKFGKDNPNYGQTRKKFSKTTKKKMSDARKGMKLSEEHKNNISKSCKGKEFSEKTRKLISIAKKSKPLSEEHKESLRLSRIQKIEQKFGQIMPNYNPDGCKIIDWFNMYYGFNFQHAENGGEVCIGGYWPDGTDEKRKILIEIDEKHHFNYDGTMKQKDIDRQRYLQTIGYNIIRVRI